MRRVSRRLLFVLALAGCEDRSLKPCDIADPACQEDIYYVDLRVRGDGYDPFGGIPPIQTKTEDQYRQELEAEAAQRAANNTTPEPWWDATLALLKLIPSEQNTVATSIDDQVTNTAAFYAWNTRSVTIVKHPNQTSDWQGMVQNMSTLAHELVHALQDRELDLRTVQHSADETLSNNAMVEGDAALYERLFDYEISLPAGYRFKDLGDPVTYFSQWRDDFFTNEFATLGAPFFAARWMVYPLGGLWQATLWKQGGSAAVRHAYGQSPTRMLDFMAGNGVTPPATVPIYCEPSIPSEFKDGKHPYGLDSFGASELYAYLFAWGVASDVARARALSWRNDYIFVYFNQSTQKTAAAWRIELASPLGSDLLATLSASNQVHVVQNGTTLLITTSDDPAFLASWNPSTACQ
jgi:hypothetical protein